MKFNRMSIFEDVKVPAIPHSTFDLSHQHKTTFNMGQLIPVLRQEVLPGDKFTISQESLLRLAPLLSPAMENVIVKTRFFFVPNRILMDQTGAQSDWELFISGDADAGIEWPHLILLDGDNAPGTLGNYMGYPDPGSNGDGLIKASVLPLAAYFKIIDDWYIAEQIQTPVFQVVANGEQPTSYYYDLMNEAPRLVGYERDYFTSALPTPQKGDPVLIPLVTSELPVVLNSDGAPYAQGRFVERTAGGVITGSGSEGPFSNIDASGHAGIEYTLGGSDEAVYDPNGALVVDPNSNAATIDTLRTAFKLQMYFETLMRAGTRYFEWVRSMFGVRPSDARLQRSEYIGSTVHNMVISEVLSTANTMVDTTETPVGQLAGHGISVGGGNRHHYYAEEHGHIIGIMQVTPMTSYYQGIDRGLTRESYLDYGLPMFANLGEQAVLRKELYADDATPDAIWGYQPRYAEYRFTNSRVTGQFQDTLLFWTLARRFTSAPTLSPGFITCDPSDTNRIFAVSEGDHIYAQIIFNIWVDRALPRFGVPSLM